MLTRTAIDTIDAEAEAMIARTGQPGLRLDPRTLAKLLWAAELDSVWTPDERVRVMRQRLARRAQLVRARSRVKNEIHAVLMLCLKDRRPRRTSSGSRAAAGWQTSS